MPVPGFGLDVHSGNESSKVGSIPRRGRLAVEYDLRDSAGRQGKEDATPGTFTIRGLYDTLPWSRGEAYDLPRFLVEDLNDLRLLLAELANKVGKAPGMSFEKRLMSGHYGDKARQANFIPDAMKELGFPGDHRVRQILGTALSCSNGDVKRAWPLLKNMVEAARLLPSSSLDIPESDTSRP